MNLKALFLTFSALPMLGFGLPSGGLVEQGQADFHSSHRSELQISCSDRTVINWDTFNIESHEALKFVQAQGDAVLNRVTGYESGLQMSQILGTLTSEGSVYIVNPEGILIGSNALIDVASFVATTLDISSADFLKLQSADAQGESLQSLILSGDSKAQILNLGTIKASSGDVHIVAYRVENQGTIEAENGAVTLTAANEAVLQPAGKRRVLIRTRVKSSAQDSSEQASLAEEGVTNSGVIKALEADIGADGSLYKLAINHTGHIEARTLSEEGGKIYLTSEKGAITVDGKLTAKQTLDHLEKGGYVEVMSERIALTKNANIDISGRHGGGVALIGSDTQGKGMPFNAEHTTVAEGSFVNASATEKGDGGKVIYWGEDLVNYYGSTLAEGGLEGGDGGFVEVSSHGKGFNKFVYTGHVSTLAANGKRGLLLWDPVDLTISNAGTSGAAEVEGPPITYTFSSDTPVINATDLNTALASSDVEITTDVDGNAEGVVSFSGSQVYTASGTLTISTPDSAGSYVNFSNASISAPNLNIVLNTPSIYNSPSSANSLVFNTFVTNLLNGESVSTLIKGSLTANSITIQDVSDPAIIVLGSGASGDDFRLIGGTTAGDVNIYTSGNLTLYGGGSGTTSGLETCITNENGAINLGNANKRLNSITMGYNESVTAGESGSLIYIGEAPDTSETKVSELNIYTSGDVSISTSQEADSFSIGTYEAPMTIDVGGDFSASNTGGDIEVSSAISDSASIGAVTFSITGQLAITKSGSGSNDFSFGQNSSSDTFEVGSFLMSSTTLLDVASNSIRITSSESYDPVITCSGNMTSTNSGFNFSAENVVTLNVTGSGSDLTLTNVGMGASVPFTVNVARDITLNGASGIISSANSPQLRVLAGREIVLNDTSYLECGNLGETGDLIVVTDNSNPSSPNVGIGNLTMASGASLRTGDNASDIYVFAGYQENNNADIDDNATFNGVAYSTLKGTLDVEDANNKFGVYYSASSLPSAYTSPATFYYKATTPTEMITEQVTAGASEIASAAASSLEISIFSGINEINRLRSKASSPSKSFDSQYGRMSKSPRTEDKPNKRPKKEKKQQPPAFTE
jgi:filamentous hemagglutinin family protein